MTSGRGAGTEFIDQAFFGFNHQDGLTIVASSLSSDDEEFVWQARLRQHLRLQRHLDMPLPPHALSYFLFAESAAVLRRVPGGDSGGRNNSHVLIGPARVLTPRVALALELWPRWQDDPPADRKTTRLHPDELDYGSKPADELRARAQEKLGDLERVLSWLLEKPGRPLSIIGCPADERVALLWGLMEIGAPILRSRGVHRDWTFSTYETDHSDAIQYLPETVCLSARPVGTSVADRTSVDLTRSGSAGRLAADQAHQLVERYVHAQSVPTGQDQPAHAERAQPVAAPSVPAPVRQQAFVPASAPFASDPVGPPDPGAMVRWLLAAQNRGDFEDGLTRVEEHADTAYNRYKIRAELNKNGYGIGLIEQLLPQADRELTFKRLLRVAFGPELVEFNNRTVRQEAERLIEKSPSDDLVSALVKMAEMRNWYEQIAPSVERRRAGQPKLTGLDQPVQSQQQRVPFPDTGERRAEPPPPEAAHSSARSAQAGLLNEYKKPITIVAWILSLTLAFILGMFTNKTGTDPVATASPAPATSNPIPSEQISAAPDPVPAAQNPETKDRPPVSVIVLEKGENGRIALLNARPRERITEGMQLWLFARRGDGTVFPQPGPCSPEGDTWKCAQIYTNLPDSEREDYEIALFIVDTNAANGLTDYKNRHPEDTPGNGMRTDEIPPGATETTLVLIGS